MDHTGNTMPKRAKTIPCLRIETLKSHILAGGAYLYPPSNDELRFSDPEFSYKRFFVS